MRREDGQIFPLMAALLLSVLALGFGLFQVARGAVLRSQAQTAADAAALAGARNAKQQLEAMMASGGYAEPSLIQDALVRSAVDDYAQRNDATVVSYYRRGVDVKVRVLTDSQLGDDAKRIDAEEVKGAAKGRARIELGAPGASTGIGGSGSGSTGTGDGAIDDDEWDDFDKEALDGKKPTCTDAGEDNDVIKLGEFLKDHGFDIRENSHFEHVDPVHTEGSYHYRCGYAGAIDVNWRDAGAEKSKIDPLLSHLQELGFQYFWQVEDHFDHIHIDVGTGGANGGAAGGGFAFGDQTMDVRLIDWDAAYDDFELLSGGGGAQQAAGPPDPEVARTICKQLDRLNASPLVRLATFETAIVESGVRNLTQMVDHHSLGVFQQQYDQGWGTQAQILDVNYSAAKFITTAQETAKGGWSGSAGMLAYAVQKCAFEYRLRYDQHRDAAMAMHDKYCG